jgi:hypothetical protein
VVDRHADRSLQVTIYVESLPSDAPEFVNGEIKRRTARPVIEAAVVYAPETGTTTTVTRGGKDVHSVLCQTFAEQLLKVQPTFDPIRPRPYRLQRLLYPDPLPTDPAHGIEHVRLRRLRLIPADRNAGALVIEAPAGQPHVSAHDLCRQWFGLRDLFLSAFTGDQATLCFHHALPAGRRRAKTLNVQLSLQNRSNLRNLSDSDRVLAEHYLEKWGLVG